MSQEPFPLDAEAIRELARLLEETGLAEIEVENAGRKLRVVRGQTSVTAFPLPQAAVHPPETIQETVVEGAVRSPMVGTAYLAGEPGAASFVKVGDEVAEGDTLLIVEAMKVMNPIRAPHGGTVTQILVSDGRPVEYGQVLMVIDPAHV
ncbi:MAG: acetyl-CoA carboxylase biotin carboxyl carrier protein subunit [bacterium]|nr:acetyl-CoA carboxylase biotin carboxyl carrier protein subunit [bacterium]